jgi:ATP-dependent DNA ligase
LRFEPKWDGFRAIARVDRDRGVNLDSRRGKSLKLGFPDVVAALFTRIPADSILDGELVRWAEDGRLDFGALQRRNHTTLATAAKLAADEPCHFIVFDLLRVQGVDLTETPLSDRRAALEALFAEIPGTSPLQLGLHTEDLAVAREWFDGFAAVGVEGIVIKPATSKYWPGERGWDKVKHYTSTEAIIGGVVGTLDRPEQLLLGRYDSDTGEFRVIGRTVPLHVDQAADIAVVLAPAMKTHPWPDELPGGWNSGGKTTEYVKVDPTVVVEVRVDVAAQAGRWRHGLRYLRLRPDIDPAAVPLDMDLTTAH